VVNTNVPSRGQNAFGICVLFVFLLIVLIALTTLRNTPSPQGVPLFSEVVYWYKITSDREVNINGRVVEMPRGLCDMGLLAGFLQELKNKKREVVVFITSTKGVVVGSQGYQEWKCYP